uniref:KID domain-containing protein n=1 Tax=Heterorhabditis bacteriophora TaxID=37862 RepID=A0A1I7W787_HETBA
MKVGLLYLYSSLLGSSGQLQIPTGISMLSVEQEVEGDDTCVLDAVLASDSKRQTMIEREHILQNKLNK